MVIAITLVVSTVALAAIDALLRHVGVYESVGDAWPAGWRPRRVARVDGDLPYRATGHVEWELAVARGIPRAVSFFLPPAVLLAAGWSLAILLALGDLPGALSGRRALGHALASLALCVARAACGWGTVAAVAERSARWFALACGGALALDALLFALPIPCSDVRGDDVRAALERLLAHAPLACGFAWSLWRRRGLTSTRDGASPVFQ